MIQEELLEAEETIKEFITKSLDELDIAYINQGNEFIDNHGNYIVKTNPKFLRPAEVDLLIGDNTKAKEKLLWKPKHNLKSYTQKEIKKLKKAKEKNEQ